MTSLTEAARRLDGPLRSLAAAHGWALAPWWPGPAQGGSRPEGVDEGLDRAAAVGRMHELGLDREERVQRGAHLTPAVPAMALARAVLEGSAPATVMDPCCGGGIFLVAARLLLGDGPELLGYDLSEDALASVWAAMALAVHDADPPRLRLERQDALLAELPTVDAILTNPPFRSAVRGLSKDERPRFAAYRQRWALGGHGRCDLSSLFLQLCADRLNDRGTLGIVLPETQLATESGEKLRRWLCEVGRPLRITHLGAKAFADAAVTTCTLVWRRGASDGPFEARRGESRRATDVAAMAGGAWTPSMLSPHDEPALACNRPTRPMGELCRLARRFTDDFYFLGRSLVEGGDDAPHPILTVAHVEPGHDLWGQVSARINRKRWHHPAVDGAALCTEDAERARRFLDASRGRRIALATRSALVEACELRPGWLAQVPLIELSTDDEAGLDLLYAQLLSPPATIWYVTQHWAIDQTGAGVDLRVPYLKAMPILPPSSWREDEQQAIGRDLRALTHAYDPDTLLALQRKILAAYDGATEDALRWWWRRRSKGAARPSQRAWRQNR